MLVIVLGETLHKIKKKTQVKHNSLYFEQLGHSQGYRSILY